jgi:hypothetical protein
MTHEEAMQKARELAEEADRKCQRENCSHTGCNGFLCLRALEAVFEIASRSAAERERAQCVEICNSFKQGCVTVAREAAGSFDADLLYEVSTAIASTCDEIAALVNAAPSSATEPPA